MSTESNTSHRVIPNPIIPGFNPDPSLCRVGKDDFYLVTSTFNFFPGLPIYHSKDLVSWTHIGNAIDRVDQLPGLSETVINGGLWAPTIRHHDGVFYIVTTLVLADKPVHDTSRWKNFYVRASHPAGPWSDPIYFDYPGYDTSPFFDGKDIYIQGSFYYRIRPEISQINLSQPDQVPQRLWSGTGQKAPEAPHVLQHKNGWYYLIIAEGGTEEGHRVSMARARDWRAPEAEWEGCPHNPILTHADLPDAIVQCTGHADLFQDQHDQWWMVLLACRNYQGRFPMGRETFLHPISWPDDQPWPTVTRPIQVSTHSASSANWRWREQDTLRYPFVHDNNQWVNDWLWIRLPNKHHYVTEASNPFSITLHANPEAPGLDVLSGSPTFVALRQCHLACRASVTLVLPENASLYAGLAIYLDARHYASIGCTREKVLFSVHSGDDIQEVNSPLEKDREHTVALSIEATVHDYKLYCDGKQLGSVDAKSFSFGFTGILMGIFASSQSPGSAQFKDFAYEIHDQTMIG